MKKPWLVQVGKFKDQIEDPKTVDDAIKLRYMGAAEFEVEIVNGINENVCQNPLYLSAKRISNQKEDYDFFKMLKRKDGLGNQMYLFCKKEDSEECKKYTKKMLSNENCKRSTFLPKYYNLSKEELEKERDKINDFWWDIENDYFIFFGDDKINIINDMLRSYKEKKPEKTGILSKIKALFK